MWTVIITMALSLITASVFGFSLGKYEKVTPSGAAVAIPTSKLTDGKAHFYKIEESGKEIHFFAIKAADGSFKTAFDACDSCYRSKKGYEQLGDKMNCKNCNQKFAISKLGPNATGGCNPGYLPSKVNGSSLAIQVSDLNAGAKYF